ncbi:biliverdin-producing heme oxygenase [Streptomyces sp. NPDC056291]|uniref:biliverdin-producing heme oxygenase n=1 Tax=Streptomyces sp. NPDC056291 TaxID=3345772 RepID=UPI0035E21F7A
MTATVVERLRASTRAWHDALENTGFATAMVARTLPLDRYVGQLAAYRVVLDALEGELSRAASPSIDRVWSADLAKLPLIERDLRYFAESDVRPKPWAAGERAAFAQEIRHTAASTPQALLGFLYVLEGSTLGGLVLRPYITTAYRLSDADGTAYYGSGDRDRWARFTARMNQALSEPEAQGIVITAAHRAYHHIAAMTDALSVGLAPGP